MSYDDYWLHILNKLKKYINENNKRPSPKEPNNEEVCSLGRWLSQQIDSYKKKHKIMKNEIIYEKFKEFIKNSLYSKFFNNME
jgi:hypothetical protein